MRGLLLAFVVYEGFVHGGSSRRRASCWSRGFSPRWCWSLLRRSVSMTYLRSSLAVRSHPGSIRPPARFVAVGPRASSGTPGCADHQSTMATTPSTAREGHHRRLPAAARVRLLEIDPDLGNALNPKRFNDACRICTAPLLQVKAGPFWDRPAAEAVQSPTLGFLVVDGLLIERIRVADRQGADLLFAGDVGSRPFQGEYRDLAHEPTWEVVDPVVLAELDAQLIVQASRWPELLAAITDRSMRRVRSLTLRLALGQIPQLHTRIHLLLWHLADRVGKVDGGGVTVLAKLSHRVLGQLVSAQRPSVSRALAMLADSGDLEVVSSGFRLTGDPPPVSLLRVSMSATTGLSMPPALGQDGG